MVPTLFHQGLGGGWVIGRLTLELMDPGKTKDFCFDFTQSSLLITWAHYPGSCTLLVCRSKINLGTLFVDGLIPISFSLCSPFSTTAVLLIITILSTSHEQELTIFLSYSEVRQWFCGISPANCLIHLAVNLRTLPDLFSPGQAGLSVILSYLASSFSVPWSVYTILLHLASCNFYFYIFVCVLIRNLQDMIPPWWTVSE